MELKSAGAGACVHQQDVDCRPHHHGGSLGTTPCFFPYKTWQKDCIVVHFGAETTKGHIHIDLCIEAYSP